MTHDDTSRPKREGWKPAVLGLFVCWQLFYLPAMNLVQFLPLRVPSESGDAPLTLQSVGRFTTDNRLQTLADAVGAGLTRYSELSGQFQFWKLFTPGFPPQTIVLVTRAEWADGRSVEIVSPLAPAAETPAVRLPRRDVRPFQFEACVGLGPWTAVPSDSSDPEATRHFTVGWSGLRARSVRVVMHDHWSRYSAEHPGTPEPVRLTLVTRLLAKPAEATPAPAETPVTDRPFVRWTDPFGPNGRLDVYDPVAGQYVPVPEDMP